MTLSYKIHTATTGDVTGQPLGYSFSFPSLSANDITVTVGGEPKTITTHYTVENWTADAGNNPYIKFTSSTARGSGTIRISRGTTSTSPTHDFQVGSAIKASDLNSCNQQNIYLAQENRDSINALALGDASSAIQIDSANIKNLTIQAIDLATDAVETNKIKDLNVTTGKIADDAITTDKLANSINSTIAANTAKVTNATHTGDVTGSTALTIANGVVTQAKLNSALLAALQTHFSNPVGTVIWFLGERPPVGYLKCNGQTINNGNTTISGNYIDNTAIGTVDTSTLYSIIGGTIPDLRGEFIRAWDDGRNIDVGRALNSFQMDAVQNHEHQFGGDDMIPSQGGYQNSGGTFSYDATSTASGSGQHMSTKNQTGRVNTQTRPRNVALLACIKY
jgi:hypothetical protein